MLKKYFQSKSKKYLLITMLISIVCPLLAFSYSSFIFYSNDYRASEMYINLLYSMKIDGESKDSVVVASGETVIDMEITSLNTKDSFYKIVYSENENIEVKYIEKYIDEEFDYSNGTITNIKTMALLIINNSSEEIEVSFDVASGYVHNGLEKVVAKDGYKIIEESYEMNDLQIVNLYVNDSKVDVLDSKYVYNLDSYSCLNNETVTFDSETNSIGILPIERETSCDVYFSRIDPSYVTFFGDDGEYNYLFDKSGNYNGKFLGKNLEIENNSAKFDGSYKYHIFENVPGGYDFDSSLSIVVRFKVDSYFNGDDKQYYVLGNTQNGGTGIYIKNLKPCFIVYVTDTKGSSGSGAYSTVCSSTTINLDTWYTIVGTYDGKIANLYVNGTNTSKTVSSTTQYVGLSIFPLVVSSQFDGNANYYFPNLTFSGTVSNAYVFNSVLSSSVVSSYYSGSITSSDVTGYLDKYESSEEGNFIQNNIGCLDSNIINYDFNNQLTYGINFKLTNVLNNVDYGADMLISNTESGGCSLQILASSYRFICYIEENSAYSHVDSTTVPEVNKWTNLVGTYDGSQLKIYVNGVLEATTDVNGNIKPSAAKILTFCEPSATEPVFFTHGYLSESFVLTDVMSESEVSSWYSEEKIDNINALFHYKVSEEVKYNDDITYKVNNLSGNVSSISCNNHSNYSFDLGNYELTIPNILQNDICTVELN